MCLCLRLRLRQNKQTTLTFTKFKTLFGSIDLSPFLRLQHDLSERLNALYRLNSLVILNVEFAVAYLRTVQSGIFDVISSI